MLADLNIATETDNDTIKLDFSLGSMPLMATNTRSGSEHWEDLVHVWEIALDSARFGQSQIVHSMHECYIGTGDSPTPELRKKVDELWAAERRAKAAMDKFISERFGGC